MKLANATNTNRKFGKPRDLRCAPAPHSKVWGLLVLTQTQ